MLTLIALSTATICGATILTALYFKRGFFFTIPFVFAVAFGTVYNSTQFLGYSLDSSLIADGQEGVVLFSSEGDNTIYVLVMLKGDKQPRLVSMPKTEEAQKEMKKKNGATVIKFGKKAGGGTMSDGNGGEAPPFEIRTFGDSGIGGKDNG